MISKRVSVSKIRMAPISFFSTRPSLQIRGTSHFGSAPRFRPEFRRNQAAPSFRSRRGRRSEGSPPSGVFLARGRACGSLKRPAAARSSGSGRRPRKTRMSVAAICTASTRSSSICPRATSSSAGVSESAGFSSSLRRSRDRIDSRDGASDQVASMLAEARTCSVRRLLAGGTIRTETPFRPALPVRPLLCRSAALLVGGSAWITIPRSGRSRPRAATSVATHTRARPSRRD